MKIIDFYRTSVQKLKLSGSGTSELDAKVLIYYVLEKDELFFLNHPEFPLTNSQQTKLNRLLKRRLVGEPIAYITGHKEFYGIDFSVNKNVLIPRPETELLVEQAIQRIRNHELGIRVSPVFRILDMGTGSGCLIISLVNTLRTEYSELRAVFDASDTSRLALNIAKKNTKIIAPTAEINFYRSDLFSNTKLHKKYDLIMANLPYVPRPSKSEKLKAKSTAGTDFEPQDAIFAEDNGAEIIKRFLVESKKYLVPDGMILIELDPRNAQEILKFAQKIYSEKITELTKDLAKKDRYLTIK